MRMNKAGKKNGLVIFGVIAVVALLALMVYAVGFREQTAVGGAGSSGDGATNRIVTSSTTLSWNPTDALQAGTAVGVTSYTSVNGGQFKTAITSADQGDKLNILQANGTTYHNNYFENVVVPNGKTIYGPEVSMPMYGNASVTLRMFNTDGNSITNGGGATNQSSPSAGSSATLPFEIDGQDKKSTNHMKCILESQAGTNTTKLELTGFTGVKFVDTAKPKWYTLMGTDSAVWVYEIDPIEGAGTRRGSLYIQSETGKILSATQSVIVHCYTKEWFLDSYDGKVKYDTQDSQGNLKSMANYKFKVAFQ